MNFFYKKALFMAIKACFLLPLYNCRLNFKSTEKKISPKETEYCNQQMASISSFKSCKHLKSARTPCIILK